MVRRIGSKSSEQPQHVKRSHSLKSTCERISNLARCFGVQYPTSFSASKSFIVLKSNRVKAVAQHVFSPEQRKSKKK